MSSRLPATATGAPQAGNVEKGCLGARKMGGGVQGVCKETAALHPEFFHSVWFITEHLHYGEIVFIH